MLIKLSLLALSILSPVAALFVDGFKPEWWTLVRFSFYFLSFYGVIFFTTFIFDGIHYILHRFENSQWPILRFLGGFHGTHHKWLGSSLKFDESITHLDTLHHLIPELATQIICSLLLLYFVNPAVIAGVIIFFIVTFAVARSQNNQDQNHQVVIPALAPRNFFFVDSSFHLYHHIFPLTNFGSVTILFDLIFGTATQIKSRKIVLFDLDKKIEIKLRKQLEKEDALVSIGEQFDHLSVNIEKQDVLITRSNSKSYRQIVELFLKLNSSKQIVPEVWTLGLQNLVPDLELQYQNVRFRNLPLTATLFLIKRGYR
jgi:monoglucosyldiacylglycerol epimerase